MSQSRCEFRASPERRRIGRCGTAGDPRIAAIENRIAEREQPAGSVAVNVRPMPQVGQHGTGWGIRHSPRVAGCKQRLDRDTGHGPGR